MLDTTDKEFVAPRQRIGRLPSIVNKGEGKWLCIPKRIQLIDKGEPRGIARARPRIYENAPEILGESLSDT